MIMVFFFVIDHGDDLIFDVHIYDDDNDKFTLLNDI